MYRNKKYLKWLLKQNSAAPLFHGTVGFGDMVYAHQRNMGNCGTSIKPPDTYALPLWEGQHRLEHSMGDKSFWGQVDRAKRCVQYVCKYLDEVHNIDGWRLALELLTKHMEGNKL